MGEGFPVPQGAGLRPVEVAQGWARAGFPVLPCRVTKAPLTPNGFRDATTDAAAIDALWRRHPQALTGIPTGAASGLFVVDLDVDRATGEAIGAASLAALDLADLIGRVPTVATPSGGRHLYFRDFGHGCSPGALGPKIDVRGNGGFVIAPGSVTPSGAYVLLTGALDRDALPEAPEALRRALRRDRAAAGLRIDTGGRGLSVADGAKAPPAEVADILRHIPPDCGYADWLTVLMGLHDHFGGSAEGQDIADRWSAAGAKYRPGEVAAKWRGFTAGGGTGWASVCDLARRHGADLRSIAARHRGGGAAPAGAPSARPAARPVPRDDGGADLIRGPRGRPVWCVENACTILETVADWRGALAHDDFAGLPMLLRPVPGAAPPGTFAPRPLGDTDITAAVRWFNRHGFPEATRAATADALFLVARQRLLSPVRDYLESLSWDGTPRVAGWLARYCGAAPDPLTAAMGKAWLVSAVARALDPGCKADCALVLEGRQGAGKSSVLRTLAGADWFHDGLRDLHGKDASAALRGKWIIELPELSAMRRSDTEAVKAFLSRTEERYRPAYARAEVVEPRRCVFAGTTNRTDYLTDDTGGRRFWPVAVGTVRLADLARDRDQLWSEAVALWRAGEPWWLDAEAEAGAAAAVAARAADDPWSADVLRAVEGLAETSARDVFAMLDIALDRRGKAEAMRITGILTRAGWSRQGKFGGGPNRGLARYVAPTAGGG